ncbi:MAG: hypothetical protein PGN09_06655 [Sphingomonas fennica]
MSRNDYILPHRICPERRPRMALAALITAPAAGLLWIGIGVAIHAFA